MRTDGRLPHELRPMNLIRNYTQYAEGSVLIEYGKTQVICTASILQGVPKFLKDQGQGWITAEYGMLPRSTHHRMDREATRGRPGGRTLEIQRLIGRSLRTVVNLNRLGEKTIYIDCDVIQADGGTRTAAITGACIALVDALKNLHQKHILPINPFRTLIASVSVGIVRNEILLDLNYEEDSSAETDANIVMDETGQFIEIQGTAEKKPFSREAFDKMLHLAQQGIHEIIQKQKSILK